MITVLGASGFIGSHLVRCLQGASQDFRAVGRGESIPSGPLGDVIYCIGVTGDFRERPFDAVDAHVCVLLDFVRKASFDSILYLSSTRLYWGRDGVAREEDDLTLNPLRSSDIYSLSKATGEAAVLAVGDKGRVARLSNVYGIAQSQSFFTSVVEEVQQRGSVTIRTAPESSRDYVSVDDVAPVLVEIALRGRERIYNVASGISISNAELARAIAHHAGCSVDFAPGSPLVDTPTIDIARIRDEFNFRPASLLDALPSLLEARQ